MNRDKPKCKIAGENGNIFNLITIVRKTLKRNQLNEDLQKFERELKEAQKHGGYFDILSLFTKYVNLE